MTDFTRRGVMLVIASPSGAGKSSISRAILDKDNNVEMSVSVTTRQRRSNEVDGVHYHFLSRTEFERQRDGGDLLEWAEVHGNYYGTPRGKVEDLLSSGRDVLFDIDYQGTLQLKEKCLEDMVTVFILPPTIAELHARLNRRAQDSSGVIEQRVKNARIELDHWAEYDYVIVNDDLQSSVGKVTAILEAARTLRVRQKGMDTFVADLQTQIDAMVWPESDSASKA